MSCHVASRRWANLASTPGGWATDTFENSDSWASELLATTLDIIKLAFYWKITLSERFSKIACRTVKLATASEKISILLFSYWQNMQNISDIHAATYSCKYHNYLYGDIEKHEIQLMELNVRIIYWNIVNTNSPSSSTSASGPILTV